MRYSPKVNFAVVAIISCLHAEALFACPDGNMLYAKGDVFVRDRAKIQGGSVRAEDTVEVGLDAHFHADVFGRNVILKDRAVVQGNITASTSLIRSKTAVVSGAIAQNTALPPCSLGEKPTIGFGSLDKTVPWDSQATVSPGSYRDLLVHSRGSVHFTPGVYNFRKIILEPDARIFVQTGGDVEINVETRVFLDGRVVMALEGQGIFPNVHIYSNQTTVLQVGHDSRLFGTLTAPKAEVRFLERTAMQGRILADRITVEIDAVISGSLDTDGDGVPDLVENMLGTNPTNAGSRPATAIPDNWENQPDEYRVVAYDYDHLAGYTTSHAVPVEIPSGTLTSDFVPVVQVKEVNDASIPAIPVPAGWAVFGKVFDIHGEITQGGRISFGFPLPDGTAPSISPSMLTALHYSGGQWVYTPVSHVQGNAAYVQASSFSPFVLLRNTTADPVVYVDMEYMESGRVRDGKSWATAYLDLNDALADARVSKKEIWVAGGLNRFGKRKRYFHFARDTAATRDTLETAFELFNGARIYGGFRGNETDRLASRSHKNQFRAYLTNGWGAIRTYSQDLQNIIWLDTYYPAERIVKAADGAYMEGFIFERAQNFGNFGNFVDYKSTLSGMGVYIDRVNMTIANCQFIGLRSARPGAAIYARGTKEAFVDSCEFHSNRSDVAGGAITTSLGNFQVNRSLFLDNSAETWGGAIDATPFGADLDGNNPDSAHMHTLVLRNCVLENNEAAFGGAVALKSMASFDNTVFSNNVSHLNGGAVLNYAGHLEVRNCTFWGSDSPLGRAYLGTQWDSIVVSFPGFPGIPGMGIRIPGDRPSSASFRNSILWNVAAVTGSEVQRLGQATIEMVQSTVKNGYSGAFAFDPLFYDPGKSRGDDLTWFTEDDGLYQSRQSPAIDTGLSLPQGWPLDILGNPRKVGRGVDLGAFEYSRIPPQVHITSHPPRSFTRNAVATIGYTSDGQAGFSQSFSLTEGANTLVVSKSKFDTIGKDSVVVILDTQPPVLTLVRPSKDTVVATSPLVVE